MSLRTCLPVFLCLSSIVACRLEDGYSKTAPKEAQVSEPIKAQASEVKGQKAQVVEAAKATPSVNPREAHEHALAWLAAHQEADGSWKGEGGGRNVVGLTGLALLALQSDGSSMSRGAHAQSIARGVSWLMTQQDQDLGLLGVRVGHSFAYDHAIATQALCLALQGAPSEQLRATCQEAMNFIARMRNPYGAWRYDYPPTGESDTSVTGWMVEAMITARKAGLTIDPAAMVGAVQWVDEVTDQATARVGYDAAGSYSSRIVGINDQFPTDQTEAMTASGMLTRMNAGQTAGSNPVLAKHEKLLLSKLPEWAPEAKLVDEYYWYFGSLATRRLGGKGWEAWRTAGEAALLEGQDHDGADKGSWDPVGPWAFSGGRVYATALNALSLGTML
jgi:hypothetical protein